MQQIDNSITRLLKIRCPIIAAPMAGASTGSLAAQVSLAGGFGFISADYITAHQLREEIEVAQRLLLTETPHVGVGFLGWRLENVHKAAALDILGIALERRVTAIWFSFGNDLGQWIDHVRAFEKDSTYKHHTLIFVQVNSVEEALSAVNEWKADVVVAQGIESGGHGSASALPLLTLIPSILAAMPKDSPPVIGAGGLASGAHVASLLVLGAAGAALGTRFLLAPESRYTDSQKAALIHASSDSTVRTSAFDLARGTTGWPRDIDGRALRNKTVEDAESGLGVEDLQQKFREGVEKGDPERMLVWAGTGVGLMKEIKNAGDIVRELHQETVARLKAASLLVQTDA